MERLSERASPLLPILEKGLGRSVLETTPRSLENFQLARPARDRRVRLILLVPDYEMWSICCHCRAVAVDFCKP